MPDIEVKMPIAGTVWKIVTKVGDVVDEDAPLMILESMKMEIPLTAPEDGTVVEFRVAEGDPVAEGDIAVIMRT